MPTTGKTLGFIFSSRGSKGSEGAPVLLTVGTEEGALGAGGGNEADAPQSLRRARAHLEPTSGGQGFRPPERSGNKQVLFQPLSLLQQRHKTRGGRDTEDSVRRTRQGRLSPCAPSTLRRQGCSRACAGTRGLITVFLRECKFGNHLNAYFW